MIPGSAPTIIIQGGEIGGQIGHQCKNQINCNILRENEFWKQNNNGVHYYWIVVVDLGNNSTWLHYDQQIYLRLSKFNRGKYSRYKILLNYFLM